MCRTRERCVLAARAGCGAATNSRHAFWDIFDALRVGFTPGAGRGSGRAVVRQYAGRSVRQGREGRAVGVIIAGLRFGISGGEKKGETIAVNMEFE